MPRYKVQIGWDRRRNCERNRYFDSLEAARRAAGAVFDRTKIVLAIIEVPDKRKRKG
jgi:hypothetical protein